MRNRHNRFGNNAGSLASAAALVVSTMVLPAHATNLLINPGFESPASSVTPTNDTVTGWTLYPTPGSNTSGNGALRANYQAHTGEWSIWLQTFLPDGGVYQNVSGIQAGTDYSLTGWFYFEAQYPNTGAVSDLELTWYGPGTIGPSSTILGTSETLIEPGSVTTNVWTQYSLTNAMAPAGATQVQVSFDFVDGSNVAGQLAAFVDDADLEGAGTAPTTAGWAVNSSGDWNASGNWTTGSIPNSAGVEADFFSVVTSPTTVYTNLPITVGTLHFNNANEYEITGTGNLTLQGSGAGSALVQVDQGTDVLDLPVTVASNTTLNVASGATLIIANPVTINSGESLTQTGTGTVTYQSIITVNSNGAIAFADSTHAHELSLASGATATLGGPVLEVDSISNLGTINILNNKLLINYGSGPDPIASIAAWIKNGFYDLAGPQIISSDIAADDAASGLSYGIGYADSADPGDPANLPSGTIEVMFTLLGDANLDGTVNSEDFTLFAEHLGQSGQAWDAGDFNNDGTVNTEDFTLFSHNLGQTATLASAGDLQADGFSLANVPEPMSAGMMVMAGLGIFRRRRR
jgi:dockerin type I repeat protein